MTKNNATIRLHVNSTIRRKIEAVRKYGPIKDCSRSKAINQIILAGLEAMEKEYPELNFEKKDGESVK